MRRRTPGPPLAATGLMCSGRVIAADPGVSRCAALISAALIVAGSSACSPAASNAPRREADSHDTSSQRAEAFRRAQVWRPVDVEAADIRSGPDAPGKFGFLESVRCDFVDKPLRGHSLKFACDVRGDVLKVKIGALNGEVYGEVAATRLLWALGFGADRMYPVRVTCRGCPARFNGQRAADGAALFDPAVIERPMPGAEFDGDSGWAWTALDLVDQRAGGAPRAHLDALKLLAVFLQHTDNKAEQQRLVCTDEPLVEHPRHCARPFLVLDDVGLTFGAATFANDNAISGANFRAWSTTPLWEDGPSCIGKLSPSFTGTLSSPSISEDGRRFLARLISRLSQPQIRALFETSRFSVQNTGGSVEDWVRVFNAKRQQIVGRRCD